MMNLIPLNASHMLPPLGTFNTMVFPNAAVDCLPPKTKSVVQYLQYKSQTAWELCLWSVLGAASLACQGHVRIQPPYRKKPLPVCMYFLAIADSGERKSAVLNSLFSVFKDIEDDCECEFNEKMTYYRQSRSLFDASKDALTNKLNAAIKKGNDELRMEAENQLIEHLKHESQPPKKIRFVYNNTTIGGLQAGLNEFPSAVLVAAESVKIMSGDVTENFSALNQLWDGEDVRVDRKSTTSLRIVEPKLTCVLFIQPKALDAFLDKHGEQARGTGVLARYLVANVPERHYPRCRTDDSYLTDHLSLFHDRIKDILSPYILAKRENKTYEQILKLSQGALDYWNGFYDYVEANSVQNGIFSSMKDFASKLPENVLRLSALLHCIEGCEGKEISVDVLNSAIRICEYAADQFSQKFTPKPINPEYITDAQLLLKWLRDRYQDTNLCMIEKRKIIQQCPNKLRKKARIELALDYLAGNNFVCNRLFQGKGYRPVAWVELNLSIWHDVYFI